MQVIRAATHMNNISLTIGRILKRQSLLALGHLPPRCRVQEGAILCLHSIVPDGQLRPPFRPRQHLEISASFLEALIVDLRRLRFDLVSLEDAIARLKHGSSRPFIAFTLDDGYADNFGLAYPIFSRHQVPFTVFVTTGFVDHTVPIWWVLLETLIRERDCVVLSDRILPTCTLPEKNAAYVRIDELVKSLAADRLSAFFDELLGANPGTQARADALSAALTWADLRTMAATGLATVGCHTVTHRPLRRLEQEACEIEILVARDRITAELDKAPRYFAYPYGGPDDVGTVAPAIVANADFEAAFSLNRMLLRRFDDETAYQVPRIVVQSQNLMLTRAYISGLPWALRNSYKPARAPTAAAEQLQQSSWICR
jgi:peptidoglycan/xylan/chitin deacetylase (PgdA/CDA1 family)